MIKQTDRQSDKPTDKQRVRLTDSQPCRFNNIDTLGKPRMPCMSFFFYLCLLICQLALRSTNHFQIHIRFLLAPHLSYNLHALQIWTKHKLR